MESNSDAIPIASKHSCPWCDARQGFKLRNYTKGRILTEMAQITGTWFLKPKSTLEAILQGGRLFELACNSCDQWVKYCSSCDILSRHANVMDKCPECDRI